jgi:hypothetical protein
VSLIDTEGQPFHDTAADAALFDAIRSGLPDRVPLVESDTDINDEAFAVQMAQALHEAIAAGGDTQNAVGRDTANAADGWPAGDTERGASA